MNSCSEINDVAIYSSGSPPLEKFSHCNLCNYLFKRIPIVSWKNSFIAIFVNIKYKYFPVVYKVMALEIMYVIEIFNPDIGCMWLPFWFLVVQLLLFFIHPLILVPSHIFSMSCITCIATKRFWLFRNCVAWS